MICGPGGSAPVDLMYIRRSSALNRASASGTATHSPPPDLPAVLGISPPPTFFFSLPSVSGAEACSSIVNGE